MMQTAQFRVLFTIAGAIWVGGWGFVMFRYPEAFARINARFGMKAFATPRYISFTKKLGIVEMVLAGLSLIDALVISAFGSKWF